MKWLFYFIGNVENIGFGTLPKMKIGFEVR